MFCSKCGTNLQNGSKFCSACGNKCFEPDTPITPKEVKVMLDPSEVIPAKEAKDSSKSFSGQGKTIGIILMMISIIGDVIAMIAIGLDAFIPVTIGATILFVVGFFLNMFCA